MSGEKEFDKRPLFEPAADFVDEDEEEPANNEPPIEPPKGQPSQLSQHNQMPGLPGIRQQMGGLVHPPYYNSHLHQWQHFNPMIGAQYPIPPPQQPQPPAEPPAVDDTTTAVGNKRKKTASKAEETKKKKPDMRYSAEEKQVLVDIIEHHLPIGADQWEHVESDFNETFPDRQRIVENLRKQFKALIKKKAPTGNPNIPPFVRQAKNVQRAIIAKANAVKLGEWSDDDSCAGLQKVLTSKDVTEEDLNGSDEAPTSDPPSDGADGKQFKTPSKTSTRKARRTAAAAANSNAEKMLEAFIASERMHRADMLRREEKEQQRYLQQQEERKERNERSDKMMEGFFTVVGAALSAYLNNNNNGNGKAVRPETNYESDSSYQEYMKRLKGKRRNHRTIELKDDSSSEDDQKPASED